MGSHAKRMEAALREIGVMRADSRLAAEMRGKAREALVRTIGEAFGRG